MYKRQVLGEAQRARTGVEDDTVCDERLEHLRGDVLVVEGHDVALAGEGPYRLDVDVLPHRGARHDEGGAVVRVGGEDREGDAELDGRPDAHPRQLTCADDADDGKTSGRAARCGHESQDIDVTAYAPSVPISPVERHADDDATPQAEHSGLRGFVDTIWHEVAKFGVVGLLAFVIDLGGMNLLTHTVLEGKPTTARIVSGVAATLFAWFGNRSWTFAHRRSRPVAHLSLIHISEPTRRS